MESWVQKYLPDCDPKMFPCALDYVPEHIFFHIEDAVRNTWKQYFDWQNVEARYSVIKLKYPWSRQVTDYKRTKALKTTHAVCLNGIPTFQMSVKSYRGERDWELESFDLPSEWQEKKNGNPEGILANLDNMIVYGDNTMDFNKSYNAWVSDYDSRAKEYDSISGRKHWGSTMTGFSWWLKKDYKEKKEMFKQRVKRIYHTMRDLTIERKYAKEFGLPNLFYRRALLLQITHQMREEKRPDSLRNHHIDYTFSETYTVVRGALQNICGGDESAPKWNKRLCKVLNELSKREHKRVKGSRFGVINHESLTSVPIYTVEQMLKGLGWTIENETTADVPTEGSGKINNTYPLLKKYKLKEAYREYSSTFGLQSFLDLGRIQLIVNTKGDPDNGKMYYGGINLSDHSALNYWGGMLLNTMNLYSEQVEFICFIDPIQKYSFPDTMSYSPWVDKERVFKEGAVHYTSYPQNQLSKKYGVLPPLAFNR
jgi:hypothetical protein